MLSIEVCLPSGLSENTVLTALVTKPQKNSVYPYILLAISNALLCSTPNAVWKTMMGKLGIVINHDLRKHVSSKVQGILTTWSAHMLSHRFTFLTGHQKYSRWALITVPLSII